MDKILPSKVKSEEKKRLTVNTIKSPKEKSKIPKLLTKKAINSCESISATSSPISTPQLVKKKRDIKIDVNARPSTSALSENVDYASCLTFCSDLEKVPSAKEDLPSHQRKTVSLNDSKQEKVLPTKETQHLEPQSKSEVTCLQRRNNSTAKTRDIKSDSDLYDRVRLKTALKVLRSNLEPGDKLTALKKSRDIFSQAKDTTDYTKWLENLLYSESNLSNVVHKTSNPISDVGRVERVQPVQIIRADNSSGRPQAELKTNDLAMENGSSLDRKSHLQSFRHCNSKQRPGDSTLAQTSKREAGLVDDVFDAAGNAHQEAPVKSSRSTRGHEPASPVACLSRSPIPGNGSRKRWSLLVSTERKENVKVVSKEKIILTLTKPSGFDVSSDQSSPKSPISIQEWVDSITMCQNKNEDDGHNQNLQTTQETALHSSFRSCSPENEDNFLLGAEAQCPGGENTANDSEGKGFTEVRRHSLLKMKEKQTSFHSDISGVSLSSTSRFSRPLSGSALSTGRCPGLVGVSA